MLSPSCPAQKTVSEEDSSGSDAGSEVSLEPETDRFGFILTNGSTAGSVGPTPELVRQREAKWINIIGQWDRFLIKKTSKVKVQCQKGIPASLRAKCWPLLCGATDRMKQNDNLYKSLDTQAALQSWVDVIERDLDRQFPFHEMFLSKDGHGQRGLFRVLKAYTQYQPEEGYCQAQGPVAAVLLMNMPAEEAFWCLVQISEQYLPGYYSSLLEGVLFDAAMLTWVLKRTCPAAHKHLQQHGVEPLMFATDWLMCLFTRHLPFNTLLRVWDLFFCHGVRVLLQVAVVLVRRVLGRAEQRKLCQGQMETLERLRGVREQVQEEDNTFITEVCSVPLSAKDLEKRTEKELERWRKDRPSSTFDPRGRCQGYRMAWARARYNEEERDRREREKGNLSLPLARSSSTLSLSPSLLHKRWRKGGRASAGDRESSGVKVTRHVSMGATEDCRSWTELRFKKVEGLQEEEDLVSEEHTQQTEHKEPLEQPQNMDKIQNTQTERVEEADTVKENVEQVEITVTKTEEFKEMEENKMLSEQVEEPKQEPAKDQTVENIIQPIEHEPQRKQAEELDSESQGIEEKDTTKETEEQVAESEHTPAVEGNWTEMEKEADADTKHKEVDAQESAESSEEQLIQAKVELDERTETENVQQHPQQVETVEEVSETTTTTESSPGSEMDSCVQAPTVQAPKVETETHKQQQQLAITETDESSKEEAVEGKFHSDDESLAETDSTKEECYHALTEAETDRLAQNQDNIEKNAAPRDNTEVEIVGIDPQQLHLDSETEPETLIICPPECIQRKEGTGIAADTEAKAETPAADAIVTEPSEAFAHCSETEECDILAITPTQENEDIILAAHSEAQVDNEQTQTVETLTETQMNEDTNDDPVAPAQEEIVTSPPQAGGVNLTAEPDGKSSLEEEISASEEPEKAKIQVTTIGVVVEEEEEEEEEGTENVEANTARNSPITECSLQVQDKGSHLSKDQTEPSNTQESRQRSSSKSSGDFRVRKSSTSRGSRLGRRLSEDLFTLPQRISQSESIPTVPQDKHTDLQSNPGAVNQTQTTPDTTPEVTERTTTQQPPQPDVPKRFGLFRRLRGEQPKKTKMQVPKILIQDFSDGTGKGKPVQEDEGDKLSSRERRKRRRERERREKEEEKARKKREKELEKERQRERRKPQTRGKSFQGPSEKGTTDAKTGSQNLRNHASESYF